MSDSVTIESHILVVDENNQPISNEDGKTLVSRKNDGILEYIERDVMMRVFYDIDAEQNASVSMAQEDTERCIWTHDNILKLVSIYKAKQSQFKSSTIRNKKIWNDISKEIENFSAEQCKNKFKYLKGKYTKKKDNMSTKASGEKTYNFQYFTEFDDIFGKDPNIVPVAIASSQVPSQSQSIEDPDPVPGTSREIEHPAKRAKTEKSVAIHVKQLMEDMKRREEERERRRQENLNQRTRVADAFERYLQFLMEKEKK